MGERRDLVGRLRSSEELLALAIAAEDERIRGVATFATPAHLEPWCGSAEEFRRAVQIAGVVGDERDLLPADALRDDVFAIDPLVSIAKIPPRRLMVGHGTEDIEIPHSDAQAICRTRPVGSRAELRLIQGAGHQLRADPRMVATLLGWLDRHR